MDRGLGMIFNISQSSKEMLPRQLGGAQIAWYIHLLDNADFWNHFKRIQVPRNQYFLPATILEVFKAHTRKAGQVTFYLKPFISGPDILYGDCELHGVRGPREWNHLLFIVPISSLP